MENVIIPLASLDGDPTTYVVPNNNCRLADVVTVVTTAITTNDVTLTFSDGTTTIGTVTIAATSAAGTVDTFTVNPTSEGKVALNSSTPLKIASTGTPGAGAVNITLVFDPFHANN